MLPPLVRSTTHEIIPKETSMSPTSTYRIISEPDTGQAHRSHRGQEADQSDRRKQNILLEAPSILEIDPDHPALQGRRIVSVEELAPTIAATDEQLRQALFEPINTHYGTIPSPLGDEQDVEELAGSPLDVTDDFARDVESVVQALRDSTIVPGLHISLLQADLDPIYTMVEIRDERRGIYLAAGRGLDELTTDRTATGVQSYLAIAHALIEIVNIELLS